MLGENAASISLNTKSVIIGTEACLNGQGQGESVAIGYKAGNTSQGEFAIALGSMAGKYNKGKK